MNCHNIILGIGVTQTISCIYVTSYSGAIMAYALYYCTQCLRATLPWTYCKPSWEEACTNDTQFRNESLESKTSIKSAAECFYRYVSLSQVTPAQEHF